MQTTLRTLLDLDARAGEDRFPVRELFHRAGTRELAYVAVDVGGWLDRREVLVGVDRFGPPDDADWPVSMNREELEDAPVLESDEGGSLDLLPPLIVGPLGYTFSPLMMAAGMNVSAGRRLPDEPGGDGAPLVTRAHDRLSGVERSGDWIGREAFGPGGALGPIGDVAVEDGILTAAILEDGTRLSFDRLRRLADQGHAIFD